MTLRGENVLLRIFLDTLRRWHHLPAYEAIVEEARRRQMAGATVLEAIEGFGLSGRLLKDRDWEIGAGREVVIEIVDTPEKIDSFVETLEPMLEGTVVTIERAWVHEIGKSEE